MLSFICNLLITIYQVTGLSIICAFLLSALLLPERRDDWISFLSGWFRTFRKDKRFRYRFFFFFSSFGILGITLLCRRIWPTPWEDVIGNFSIFNTDGSLCTDSVNNILLFIPFSALMCASSFEKADRFIHKNGKLSCIRVLLCTGLVSFSFSLTIEVCQSIFYLGTFQLADIYFNTMGGLVGGGIYGIRKKVSSIIRRR